MVKSKRRQFYSGLLGAMLLTTLSWTKVQAQPYGLEVPPKNTQSIFIPPGDEHAYTVERAFPHLVFHYETFDHKVLPAFLTSAQDGTNRLFTVFLGGVIRVFPKIKDVSSSKIFLDLSLKVNPLSESGMLGLAFHPRFGENGKFYVTYTTGKIGTEDFLNVLSEFTVSPENPDSADIKSERVLLSLPHPHVAHHMAQIAFGPDGFLYVGQGDGGVPTLVGNPAQDNTNLFGALLRLDVDGRTQGLEYSIPADNPLIGNVSGWREENWAWGFRNPWRFSFDSETGELWLGDVGATEWEEVNIVKRGKNYGWPNFEGSFCHQSCSEGTYEPPIHAYDHKVGHSVIGGYVYRGSRFPELHGVYIFGDYMNRQIWGLVPGENGAFDRRLLAVAPHAIYSFGIDEVGEIYILGEANAIFQLGKNSAEEKGNIPESISASMLFKNPGTQQPNPWVIPYSINAPSWSNGKSKNRFFSLPVHWQVRYQHEGGWTLPTQSIFVENHYLDTVAGDTTSRRIVETRVLVKKSVANDWSGYSYMWNQEGTDARLLARDTAVQFAVRFPKEDDAVRFETHEFPSREDCRTCHSPKAEFLLGFKTSQLNKLHDYGEVTDHQFRTWEHMAIFRVPPSTQDYASLPYQPNPFDKAGNVEARARSYLDANCAHCHQPGGFGRGNLDMRFFTATENVGFFNLSQTNSSDGKRRSYILPGHPDDSEIYRRLAALGNGAMPPLAKSAVDEQGLDLIRAWITSEALGVFVKPNSKVREENRFKLFYRKDFLELSTSLSHGVKEAPPTRLHLFDGSGKRVVNLSPLENYTKGSERVWQFRCEKPLPSGMYWLAFTMGKQRRVLPLMVH